MTAETLHLKRDWPGTDVITGWPKVPKHACHSGQELCHVAIQSVPTYCWNPPGLCPFYGRYPDLLANHPEVAGRSERVAG